MWARVLGPEGWYVEGVHVCVMIFGECMHVSAVDEASEGIGERLVWTSIMVGGL